MSRKVEEKKKIFQCTESRKMAAILRDSSRIKEMLYVLITRHAEESWAKNPIKIHPQIKENAQPPTTTTG